MGFYHNCGKWQILLAEDFLLGGGNLRRSDLDHLSLKQSQKKTKKQTKKNLQIMNIKVKIIMNCLYKKYDVEIKMVQE